MVVTVSQTLDQLSLHKNPDLSEVGLDTFIKELKIKPQQRINDLLLESSKTRAITIAEFLHTNFPLNIEGILQACLDKQQILEYENIKYPLLFITDRDQSISLIVDHQFKQIVKEDKRILELETNPYIDWHSIASTNLIEMNMHKITNYFLRAGVPTVMVTGAYPKEVHQRIRYGAYCPLISGLVTGTEEFINLDWISQDVENINLIQNLDLEIDIRKHATYLKSYVLEVLEIFVKTDDTALNCKFGFYEDMGTENPHQFLTGFYFDKATLTEGEYLRSSILKVLGSGFKVTFGVEHDPEGAKAGKKVRLYYDIWPDGFDGKKFYFERIANISKELVRANNPGDKVEPFIFGICDSRNDFEAMTSAKNHSLIAMPYGAQLAYEDSILWDRVIKLNIDELNFLENLGVDSYLQDSLYKVYSKYSGEKFAKYIYISSYEDELVNLVIPRSVTLIKPLLKLLSLQKQAK